MWCKKTITFIYHLSKNEVIRIVYKQWKCRLTDGGFVLTGSMTRVFRKRCILERYPPSPLVFFNTERILPLRKTFIQGTIGTWVRCNRDSLAFETLIWDVRPYHANLSTKGYRSLVYRWSVRMLYIIHNKNISLNWFSCRPGIILIMKFSFWNFVQK